METHGRERPLVGITIGDPAGVGPEAAVKAVLLDNVTARCRPVLVGAKWIVDDAVRQVAPDASSRFFAVKDLSEADALDEDAILVFDTANVAKADVTPGQLTYAAGVAAAEDTETAVRLAMAGQLDAIVSGPVNKQGLQMAGRNYPGQTEFVRALTNGEQPLKVLAAGNLRVAQLSSHMSLAEAIRRVTQEGIVATVKRFDHALRDGWGIEKPRIAVAALNPHAGDNGLLGREEIDIIKPAIVAAAAEGINVAGPVPADVVYGQGEARLYDGIVSMYHDQATIPLKRLRFASVSYGLPIIRTTPGHGTAYDIVGKNLVDPTAMVNAIEIAARMAERRRDDRKADNA